MQQAVVNPVFLAPLLFNTHILDHFIIIMTSKEEFRVFAHAMVDYIIDYHANIKSRLEIVWLRKDKRPIITSKNYFII